MASPSATDELSVSLATTSPTPRQRNAARTIMAFLLAAFVVTAPYATVQLPQLNAFVPTLLTVVSVTNLITAILLLGHFFMVGTGAILVLAAGYLFSSLIVVPYALSFPGAFASPSLFGGPQTAFFLYVVWQVGFPTTVIAYAFLKDGRTPRGSAPTSVPSIVSVIVIVVLAVSGLTWGAVAADGLLPGLMSDDVQGGTVVRSADAVCLGVSAVAVLLLWRRSTSILDLWIMVAACAGVTEPLLGGLLGTTRFSLGFYASRGFSIATSAIVLAALLSEAAILHGRLSRAVALLQHERDSKLINLEAVIASITHEIRQPLSAIASNSSAVLLLLEKTKPDLDEARAALGEIVQDCMNASQIFDGVRRLFKGYDQAEEMIDFNAIVNRALHMLRGELNDDGVIVVADLASRLPLASAHKGQMLELVLNLLHNSVDAMQSVTARPKLLRVKTERNSAETIMVTVADTGPGVDPQKAGSIFDAFVTTKKTGMGLGLAISRMIVERHGGRIWVSSEPGHGALFRVVLPTKSRRSS